MLNSQEQNELYINFHLLSRFLMSKGYCGDIVFNSGKVFLYNGKNSSYIEIPFVEYRADSKVRPKMVVEVIVVKELLQNASLDYSDFENFIRHDL